MKSKRNLSTLVLVGTLAVALSLTGCGRRPANVPDAADPSTEASASPAPAASAAPVDTTTTPAVTTPAYTQPVMTGSLAVSGVQKKKKGIIFKKYEVTGQVVNTSQSPLSGTLKIDFKQSHGIINKSLSTSETKTQAITNLAPGQSITFDITSDHSADDAEVTVDTTPAAAAPVAPTMAAQGYGQPAYGQNPYGAPQQTQAAGPYGY